MRDFFFGVFFLFTLCSYSQQYPQAEIDEILLKNADVVVRLDDTKVEIQAIDRMLLKKHSVITILNKDGLGHSTFTLGYDKQNRIKNLNLYAYDAQGNKILHVKKKDFKDFAAVDGFSLYTDNRMLYYDYTPIAFPFTLELQYSIESSDTAAFPNHYFLPGFDASLEKSRFSVQFPDNGLKPIFKENNLQGLSVQKKESDHSIEFYGTNLEAIVYEELCPSFTKIAPYIQGRLPKFSYKGYVGENSDWNSIGKWMYNTLLKTRTQLDEGTVQKIENLTKNASTREEKAKIVYQFVQDNTRYVSVQEGIGGLQPIAANEVDAVKYGDCKGLTNYTLALLQAIGVESYYTRVFASPSNQRDVQIDFPTFLGQSNHVILNIPNGENDIWLECTSQVMPFDFLGNFTDNRNVFVVKPDGGEIIKTTAYLDEDNYRKIKGNYLIDENGGISGEIEISSKGIEYDNRFGLEKLKEDEIKEYYLDFWDNINGLGVLSFDFINQKDAIEFKEKIKVVADSYLAEAGDNVLFKPNAFDQHEFVPLRYRSRKHDFEIKRGFLHEAELIIELPSNTKLENLPEDTKISSKFGEYAASIECLSANELLYKHQFLLKAGHYLNTEYADYRSFRKKISKAERRNLILSK